MTECMRTLKCRELSSRWFLTARCANVSAEVEQTASRKVLGFATALSVRLPLRNAAHQMAAQHRQE